MILELSIRDKRPVASVATTPLVRTRARPPRFIIFSEARAPRSGLLFSTLLHMTFVGMLIWLPTLLPIKPANKVRTTADLIREYDYQPLVLPRLPALEDSAPNARIPQSASVALRVPPAAKRTLVSHLPKPDYSGPQEMASDPPDPTNTVEIVRRLDLVAPPDLVYPVRLPSLVMLPPRATPLPVALKVDPPVLAQPQQIDIAVARRKSGTSCERSEATARRLGSGGTENNRI